jgi:hypothetical protein
MKGFAGSGSGKHALRGRRRPVRGAFVLRFLKLIVPCVASSGSRVEVPCVVLLGLLGEMVAGYFQSNGTILAPASESG